MRIHEIHNELHSYVATVRVSGGESPITVKTKVDAESPTRARALLCHVYGSKNVLSVSEIVLETPRTDQIQLRATVIDKTAQTSRKKPANGPTTISQVSETDSAPKPPDPAELRVKSLNDQAKRLKQQAKQMKAQDAARKAQTHLEKIRINKNA